MVRYKQGWRALNRLLHKDRSFSGGEKNCGFLNLGRGEFASVSSVAGLDFADDGRAIATCDWDFDGRLDLWETARTAPRIRFLRNQYAQPNHFVAFFLRGNGVSTNRDGIGARVELVLADGSKRIKTRRAGDGFLTQASGWVHFGLTADEEIASVVVRWPGDTAEKFAGSRRDRFHILEQGTSKAATWTPPTSLIEFRAADQIAHPDTQTARIVLPYRLPLPVLDVHWQGQSPPPREYDRGQIKVPTLVTIWSSACPNCLAELSEWGDANEQFADGGLRLLAICTDETTAEAKPLMERIGSPLIWGLGTETTIAKVDLFQRGVMDRWSPMPVPCSFLVDQSGSVVSIYKGRVNAHQIIADLALLDATDKELQQAATPFSGRWMASPPAADPLRISSQMIDHLLLSEAIDYLERSLPLIHAKSTPQRAADAYFVLSILNRSQGRKADAIKQLQKARQLNPSDARVLNELGQLLGESGNPDEASVELEAAVRVNPNDLHARQKLAVALMQSGRSEEAASHLRALLIRTPEDANLQFLMANCQSSLGNWKASVEHYDRVVQLVPDRLLAANNLAYILAAHPSDEVRDSERALRLAEQTCERANFSQPQLLDTLAVALAANGKYDEAIATCDQAIALWKTKDGTDKAINQCRAHQALFRQEKPFIEDW